MDDEAAPPPPPTAPAAAAPPAVAQAAPAPEVVMPPPPPPVEELMDQDGDDLEGPVFNQRESADHLVAQREKLKELTPMTPLTRPLKQKARALKLAEITRPLSECYKNEFSQLITYFSV